MTLAIFRDGPLGGQYRELIDTPHYFRVPSLPRASAMSYARDSVILDTLSTEDYELVRVMSGPRRVAEYRWVNPAESLRAELKRVRAQRDEAEAKVKAAKRALSGGFVGGDVQVHVNGVDLTGDVHSIDVRVQP